MITLSVVKVGFIKNISKGFTTTSLLSRGFTLIELLIVIGVIGVLAAVILVAIDPVEQLARGRDAGRKSSVAQLGRALLAYYTNNSVYPAAVAGWDTTVLVNSGDIKVAPVDPTPQTIATTCAIAGTVTANRSSGNYCYKHDSVGPNILVYIRMESRSENNKDTAVPSCGANIRYFIYASVSGRAGLICSATEPLPAGPFTYL